MGTVERVDFGQKRPYNSFGLWNAAIIDLTRFIHPNRRREGKISVYHNAKIEDPQGNGYRGRH